MISEPIWYVATPYRRFSEGLQSAFEEAAKAVAVLSKLGLNVFSPIVHGHPQSQYGEVDPFDDNLWTTIDQSFIEVAKGLIVVKMTDWNVSLGVTSEIQKFREAGKPVMYMEWKQNG